MPIITSSPWLHTGAFHPKTYIGNNGPAAGMVRYNTNTQGLEIFDGVSWTSYVENQQEISTTGETDLLLSWVRKKMIEETEIEKLSQENPAVAAAYENFKKSADQLKTTIILSKDDKPTS